MAPERTPPQHDDPPQDTQNSSFSREMILQLIVGIVLVFVGAIVSYFIFRADVMAAAKCGPSRGDAPLTVECINESQRATSIRWDFGEVDAPQLIDQDEVTHEYEEAGEYSIVLSAHGKGQDEWKRTIVVTEASALTEPIRVDAWVSTRPDRVVRSRSLRISQTKDDHPSTFSSHSRRYDVPFTAAPGFKIVDTIFRAESSNEMHDFHCNVNADQTAGSCSFRLKSGPGVDRWRGWVHGRLEIQEVQEVTSQNLQLADNLELTHYGTYTLPESVPLEDVASLKISLADGSVLVIGSPEDALVAPDRDLAFRLFEHEGEALLEVRRARAED